MKAAAAPTMPASTGASRGGRSTTLIRGCNPAPGAWTTLDGKTLQDFRRQAAAGQGPQRDRRQDGRGGRGRRRRLHRRLRRRPHQGHARATRRRHQGRRRRIRRQLQSSTPGTRFSLNPTPATAAKAPDACRLAARQSRNPTSRSRRPPRSGRSWRSRSEKLGIAPENLEPYGHYKAKVSMDYIKSLQGQAERQADPGLGDHADAGRRRQDHHHGRPDRRAQPHRQEGDAVPARAVARARRSA